MSESHSLGKTIGSALAALSSFILSGGKRVIPEVREARLKICKECHPSNFCPICHCYIPIKTIIPTQECPIKKWGVSNETESESPEVKINPDGPTETTSCSCS